MADELDKMLEDIEAEKAARLRQEAQMSESLKPDAAQESALTQSRQDKVSSFKLSLNLEEGDGPADEPAEHNDAQPSAEDGAEAAEDTAPKDVPGDEAQEPDASTEAEEAQEDQGKKGRKKT